MLTTIVSLLAGVLLPSGVQSAEVISRCERLRLATWNDAESLAWRYICKGRPANFHEHFGKLDPRNRDGWDQKRRLSMRFLEAILIDHRFRSAIPSRGIRIAGAWLTEPLDLVNAKLDSELRIEQSRFEGTVLLSRLKTPFVLSFRGSTFTNVVQLDGVSVGEVLDLRESSFGQCDMTSAKVERHIDLQGAHFSTPLRMDAIHVGQSVFMRAGAEFVAPVTLVYGVIGLNLDLSGARLASLNLTGTRINGELRVGSKAYPFVTWTGEGGRLILRNVVAGALQDWTIGEPWPKQLDLRGFTYDHFGGLGSGEIASDPEFRPTAWFTDWLGRSPNSFQPYRQLAHVLSESGQVTKGEDILFAGRERERRHAPPLRWLVLTAAKVTIGYGYGARYFYALPWAVGFVLLGAVVLRLTGEGKRFGMTYGLAYSFDMLLPIIKLREWHYSGVDLRNPARYYFYLHKIAGFVLSSFLIAGIGGLTR